MYEQVDPPPQYIQCLHEDDGGMPSANQVVLLEDGVSVKEPFPSPTEFIESYLTTIKTTLDVEFNDITKKKNDRLTEIAQIYDRGVVILQQEQEDAETELKADVACEMERLRSKRKRQLQRFVIGIDDDDEPARPSSTWLGKYSHWFTW